LIQGGKAVDEKTLSFYCLFIQYKKTHDDVGLDENVYVTHKQLVVLAAVTDIIRVCLVHNLYNISF